MLLCSLTSEHYGSVVIRSAVVLKKTRRWHLTTQTVKSFYSDGAPEIVAVANKMGWTGDTSTLGIPWKNSVIEKKVKLVVNGGRSLLLQAGVPSKFLPYATQAFCNGLIVVAVGETS